MPFYQYKVVPAPDRAERQKGLKGAARFAATLEKLMNEMGADGWEFHRAETLADEERKGFASRVAVTRNVLIFRREINRDPTRLLPPADEDTPRRGGPPRRALVADR